MGTEAAESDLHVVSVAETPLGNTMQETRANFVEGVTRTTIVGTGSGGSGSPTEGRDKQADNIGRFPSVPDEDSAESSSGTEGNLPGGPRAAGTSPPPPPHQKSFSSSSSIDLVQNDPEERQTILSALAEAVLVLPSPQKQNLPKIFSARGSSSAGGRAKSPPPGRKSDPGARAKIGSPKRAPTSLAAWLAGVNDSSESEASASISVRVTEEDAHVFYVEGQHSAPARVAPARNCDKSSSDSSSAPSSPDCKVVQPCSPVLRAFTGEDKDHDQVHDEEEQELLVAPHYPHYVEGSHSKVMIQFQGRKKKPEQEDVLQPPDDDDRWNYDVTDKEQVQVHDEEEQLLLPHCPHYVEGCHSKVMICGPDKHVMS